MSLVGPTVYELWKTDRTWHGLMVALSSIGAEWWFLGISPIVFLIFWHVERYLRKSADRSLLDDRLLLTQFGKIAIRLADGVGMTKAERKAEQSALLPVVLSALHAGCFEVEDVRIIFYMLNNNQKSLNVVDYLGDRQPSGPFIADTPRGDDALTFVTTKPSGYAELIEDTKKEKREGWSGSGTGYRTYISAVVGNASGPIGMLSIDAKNPDTLSHADKRYASVAAGLLAIAYTPLR